MANLYLPKGFKMYKILHINQKTFYLVDEYSYQKKMGKNVNIMRLGLKKYIEKGETNKLNSRIQLVF
ncbi:hypothetical protein [uncultured Algibacter sp.]|uniref:hypothetical protein n=1 Tax=uncultured Algibacter sp. TaxID=298659 RepID=UPI002635AC1A|nr:hypothetical protein [uncultured Algibacter sp.]